MCVCSPVHCRLHCVSMEETIREWLQEAERGRERQREAERGREEERGKEKKREGEREMRKFYIGKLSMCIHTYTIESSHTHTLTEMG